MITHVLKIGQRIFDTHDKRWGSVLLIGGEDRKRILSKTHDDTIITYKPDNSDGECETLARDAYPLKHNKYYWGEDVCVEINRDKFDSEHNYDYYCPGLKENCWEFETC